MKKMFRAPGYNMVFDDVTGTLARWGKTVDDDPTMCPIGPEIADIEISTICHGIGKTMETRRPCSFCYKSNTGCGENMSYTTFVQIFKKFPKVLTQIAFGIGDIDGNPDLWAIMGHCRNNGVVPNITTNGMGIDDTRADLLSKFCGAVAVSHYGNDDICFNAVYKLSQHGLKQVNIHKLLSMETYDECFDLIMKTSKESKTFDARLGGLKAIVFLLLKPKGSRNKHHPVDDVTKYQQLLEFAAGLGVNVGMDSCSAPMALRSLPEKFIQSIEPCESTLFSLYVNVKGEVFPCSFTESTPGWESGIPLTQIDDFYNDVWMSQRVQAWRDNLLGSSSSCTNCPSQKHCRSCPTYPEVTSCKLVNIGNQNKK